MGWIGKFGINRINPNANGCPSEGLARVLQI